MSTPGGSGGLSADAFIRLGLPDVEETIRKLTQVRDLLKEIGTIGGATGMMGSAPGGAVGTGTSAASMPTSPTPGGMSAAPPPSGMMGPPSFSSPAPSLPPQVTAPLLGSDANGNQVMYGWNHQAGQYQPLPGGGAYGGGGNFGGTPAVPPSSMNPSPVNPGPMNPSPGPGGDPAGMSLANIWAYQRVAHAASRMGTEITQSNITGEPVEAAFMRNIPLGITMAGTAIGGVLGSGPQGAFVGSMISSAIASAVAPVTTSLANKINSADLIKGSWGEDSANSLQELEKYSPYSVQDYTYSNANALRESGLSERSKRRFIQATSAYGGPDSYPWWTRPSAIISGVLGLLDPTKPVDLKNMSREEASAFYNQDFFYRKHDAEAVQSIGVGWQQDDLTRGLLSNLGGVGQVESQIVRNPRARENEISALQETLPADQFGSLVKQINSVIAGLKDFNQPLGKLPELLDRATKSFEGFVNFAGSMAVVQLQASGAQASVSYAAATGDFGYAKGAYGETVKQAKILLDNAENELAGNPNNPDLKVKVKKARQMYAEAQITNDTAEGAIATQIAESQTASAQVAMQASLYSGATPSMSMFEGVRAGYKSQLVGIDDRIEKLNRDGYGNGVEAQQLKAKRAQIQYQATIGVTRQAQETIWQERSARVELGITQYSATQVRAELYGSGTEQAQAGLNEQLNAIEKRKQLLQEELATRRELTQAERESYQTQIAQLTIDEKRASSRGQINIAQAEFSQAERAATRTTFDAQLVLGSGAGGLQAFRELGKFASASGKKLEAAQAYLSKVVSSGRGPGNPDYDQAAQAVQGAKLEAQEAYYAQFTPPISAVTRGAITGSNIADLQYRMYGSNPYEAQLSENRAIGGSLSDQRQIVALAKATGDPEAIARATSKMAEIMSQQAQNLESLAHPVMPLSQVVGESTLQAKMAISQLTFAPQQNIRGNLEAEMDYKRQDISRLNKRLSDLQGMGPEAEGARASLHLQINQTMVEAAQVQHQLEEGALDRLISQSYNTPSHGILATSGFTNREASMFYGIYHQSFGGTKSQMDHARGGFSRYLQNMGANESIISGSVGSAYSQMFPHGSHDSIGGYANAPDANMRAVQPNVSVNIYIDGKKISPERVDIRSLEHSTDVQRTTATAQPQQFSNLMPGFFVARQ